MCGHLQDGQCTKAKRYCSLFRGKKAWAGGRFSALAEPATGTETDKEAGQACRIVRTGGQDRSWRDTWCQRVRRFPFLFGVCRARSRGPMGIPRLQAGWNCGSCRGRLSHGDQIRISVRHTVPLHRTTVICTGPYGQILAGKKKREKKTNSPAKKLGIACSFLFRIAKRPFNEA